MGFFDFLKHKELTEIALLKKDHAICIISLSWILFSVAIVLIFIS